MKLPQTLFKLKFDRRRGGLNPAVTPQLPVSKDALIWLISCLLLVTAYHANHVPVWAVLAALVIGAWRLRSVKKGSPIPSKIIRYGLTAAAFAGVIITFRAYMGRDPGMTALVLLSTLKLLELKNQRDFMFVVYLCFFLVLGNFLYTQSIPSLLFMVLASILILAATLRLNHQEKKEVKTAYLIKSAAKLTLYTLPFMLILFFFFPRTTGPLWNLPQDPQGKFRSGFDDSIYPGKIAELAESNAPAFRVTFPDDNMPATRDLYFRGVVLWFTNARFWLQGILPSDRVSSLPGTSGTPIFHTIILEPHFMRWIFTLDVPDIMPRWTRQLPGRVYHTWRLVDRYIEYDVVSRLGYQYDEPLDEKYRRWALQLPRNVSQRIKDLATSWREKATTDEDIVRAALEYFRDDANSFVYSLKPGVMDNVDPFGDFLFVKRKGFCEHYAGAFGLLMRSAGVPTRLVAGYQGGVYNKVGKYLLVRQADAHVWCEVWFEGKGWQRVDPTSAVSPERIEYGRDISDSLENIDDNSEGGRSDAVNRALKRGFFRKLFETLEEYWDTINNKWNLWIMTYDRYRQRSFLRDLGIYDTSWMTSFFIIAVILSGLFFLFAYLFRRRTAASEPLLEAYRRFCKKMARAGVERYPWEGPQDFEKRLIAAFPGDTESIHEFIQTFIEMRYGKTSPVVDEKQLKGLKKQISKINLK